MSIKFPVLQKFKFPHKVFLFILSISIFVSSSTAHAAIQTKKDTVKTTGAAVQATKPVATATDSAGVKGDTLKALADPTDTTGVKAAALEPGVEPTDTAGVEEQVVEREMHHGDSIKRGERFFKGMLPHNSKQPSCVSCHNINHSDTLNWNPSALDIANKYIGKDLAAFQAVVMQPAEGKMAEVHKGYQFSEADLQMIKAYLDNLSIRGPVPLNPNINQLLLVIFLIVVLIWALLELMAFRKIKYKSVPVVILLGTFSYLMMIVYNEASGLGRSQNYEPEQPIKFSHKVHAGQNKIDCMYCHFTAERSKSAGIPPADLCLNCHTLVREGTRSGKFEIAKVIEANEKQIPIEWIKIHDLPDHVFFSHAQHVNAGKLDCKECHGDVAQMDVVKQVEDLSMGWCLNCHRTKEVQFANNNFYESYEKLHEQIKSGKVKKVTVDMIGGTDCMKCHY